MAHPAVFFPAALALLSGLPVAAGAASAERQVDHRFSPATWQAPLGVPDDWHKPMTNERGALLYDFGPGPYAQPLTVVAFDLFGIAVQPVAQRWSEPRVPIVQTTLAAGAGRVEVTTLSVPPATPAETAARFPRYERLDGISGALGWAQPEGACRPEFRNVAWGVNRPVRYRIRVEAGASKRIALGFCESYKPRLNERVAAMHVEGAPRQVADLALTAPRQAPQVFLFDAADADRDGWIDLKVEAPAGRDPNTTLAMIAVYAAGTRLDRESLIAGSTGPADPAELRIACGTEMLAQAPRVDAMQAVFPDGAVPVLTVRTGRTLRADAEGGLALGEAPFIRLRPRAEKIERTAEGWILRLPAGTTRATAWVHSGRADETTANAADGVAFARVTADAVACWRANDIPYGRVTVGDPAIQGLADVALRTVYQARERIHGAGQFNSSFSLYRGLWAGDAVYMIELAALLGDFARARECLDTIFTFQNPAGLIDELPPLVLYRATPAVFWALERYARLSGDWAAVERHWPAVERGVQALRAARDATWQTPDAANAGLLPPGFNDGGIAEISSEYSSVYWAMTGLRATARAGRQIGRAAEAAAIAQLADEFTTAFQRASQRDRRTDAHGHRYLPVRVGLTGRDEVPQLAQWAVLEHHLFGEGLSLEGELLQGTLAMLGAAEVQGLPHSIGWLRDGLWVGYGALYAHLPLLLGRHEKAADLLYAVANHASPLGGWVEEQARRDAPPKLAGDQPHVWAAALFVRLCASMLAAERAGTTHLLRATPPEWLRPGAVNRLEGLRVSGGPLSLVLRVAADGRRATLEVVPPPAGKFTLHLASLGAAGFFLESPAPAGAEVNVRPGERQKFVFERR